MKQPIGEVKEWKYGDEADSEFSVDNFLDKADYRFMTVQSEDYFHTYKSIAIYFIHYFSNKFVVSTFILSEYKTTNNSFV